MSGDFQCSPMWRLMDRKVRSGLVMAWRLATSPTRTSPAFEKATTDGVVRAPSALGMTTGSPASRNETTELVVPRSMPTAFAMVVDLLRCEQGGARDVCLPGYVPAGVLPTRRSEKLSVVRSI